MVVNMRPETSRAAPLTLDRKALGLGDSESLTAHDLRDDTEEVWVSDSITIECTPEEPVRVFRLEPRASVSAEVRAS